MSAGQQTEPEYMWVAEAASYLGVSENLVRKWFDNGRIEGHTLPDSGHRRLRRESVEEMRRGLKQQPRVVQEKMRRTMRAMGISGGGPVYEINLPRHTGVWEVPLEALQLLAERGLFDVWGEGDVIEIHWPDGAVTTAKRKDDGE